jgi:rare lipoprotein A
MIVLKSIVASIVALALCIASTSPLLAQAPNESDWPASQSAHRSVKRSETLVGRASWYGPGMEGQKTATGGRFDSRKLTAASSRLPLNSRAVVTNLKNGRSVMVKVNDCGPAEQGRKIDLSKQAARKVGMLHQGVVPVKVKVIHKPPNPHYCSKNEASR